MAIWATVQAFINWVLNYSDNHVIFKYFNPSILPITTQAQMAYSNFKKLEWEIKLPFKPTLRSWPWYIFILLCGRIFYLPGEGEIFSLKIPFRCGIFISHLDWSFSSNCLQNVCYKNNLWLMGIFLPFSEGVLHDPERQSGGSVLYPLKFSFRLGSATKRDMTWHLKSTQHGWEASGAALAFAGSHKQRTQMQTALICALLNSNDCAHILQSLGSKKPVCADQGLKLILAMSGLWDYSLFILCKIIMDYSFTESPKVNGFPQLCLVLECQPITFLYIFIVMYTCCKAEEEKRAGSH